MNRFPGPDGLWRADLLLRPGKYEYRFVVDGIWTDDPLGHNSVENPFGKRRNSVLVVGDMRQTPARQNH